MAASATQALCKCLMSRNVRYNIHTSVIARACVLTNFLTYAKINVLDKENATPLFLSSRHYRTFSNISSLQEPLNNFTFFIPSMFLQSMYHQTSALCDTPFITYMNSTRFGTEVPSSRFHFNKRYVNQQANICSVPPYKNDKIL